MAIAEGTQNRLGYTTESAWGTPSGTAYTVVRKLAGANMNLERTQLTTAEMNNRRAVTSMRLGTKKPRMSVPFELFYSGSGKQFDDFLESWMCNAWTAAVTAQSNASSTLGAVAGGISVVTNTTPAGTSLTSAILGKWIKMAGCSTAANNGYYKVVAWTSATNFSIAVPNATVQGFTAGAQGAAVTFVPVAYVVPGATVKSLAFEEAQLDIESPTAFYKQVKGAIANTFSLNMTPDALVTGSFDFFGKDFATGTVAYSATNPAAPTNQPMTANDTHTYLMVDNVAVAVVTNLSLTATNNLEDLFPIGSISAYGIGKGDSALTGTMDLYLLDKTWWDTYQNETQFSISMRLMDNDGGVTGNGYAIDIPRCRVTSLSEAKEKTKVMLNVPFMALEKATADAKGGATVNMVVSRLA